MYDNFNENKDACFVCKQKLLLLLLLLLLLQVRFVESLIVQYSLAYIREGTRSSKVKGYEHNQRSMNAFISDLH